MGLDAAAFALAGLIALLVVGTEVLAWHWSLVLAALGLAWGLYRGLKQMPSPYRLLQAIDHRLELADGLSTAYYFSLPQGLRRGSDRARQAQRRAAEALAEQIDVRRAVPLEAPRRLYLTVLLAVAASTLLAARYGVERSLDLNAPISPALADAFGFSAQLARAVEPPPADSSPEPLPTAEESNAPGREPRPEAEQPGKDPVATENPPGAEAGRRSDDQRDSDGQSEGRRVDPGREARQESKGDSPGPPPPAEPPAPESDFKPNVPEPDSDLIRKLEDAFANLLAKLKIPPLAGQARRTSERSAAEGANPETRDGQSSRQPAGSPEGEGRPTADPQGARAPEGARQAQAGRGEGADQSSEQAGQEQAQSGIGSKDGAKDIKAQQQAEAMGKLSEILGRRAENIKGEVLIEVSSGDQSLQTPYSERAASHREAGGQIHRDEVPLVYHEYLQRYFERVRKADAR